MLIKLRKRTAQSTLEYAVLVVVLIGALLSIQTYLKQGIMGKMKSSTDDISAEQYDPEKTTHNKTTTTRGSTQENSSWNGSRTQILGDGEKITVNASSNTID